MLGTLISLWLFVMFWSYLGWFPVLNRITPPPTFDHALYGGAAVILIYLFWPLISRMAPIGGTRVAGPTAGGTTLGGALVSFGQWVVTNLFATPLLFGSLLITAYVEWPSFYNFLVFYYPIILVGMVLASFAVFLIPRGDPRFRIALGNALVLLVTGAAYVGFQMLLHGTWCHGKLKNGQIHVRPFDLEFHAKDKIRVKLLSGQFTFPRVLIDPGAKPDQFVRVDAKGHGVEMYNLFNVLGNPLRPKGELLVVHDGTTYLPLGQKGGGEFQVSTEIPLEFTFNIDDHYLTDSRSSGDVWVIIYINPHLTPGGWAETSVKRFKAILGTLAFIALAFLAIGLIWYYIHSQLGKQVAVVVAIVAISIVGLGIWGTRDAQKKVEYKNEWKQKIQETVDDPFASPTAKMEARQAQRTGNRPVHPESSFERAQRTVSVNTGPFKIAAGFILILAFLAGVRKFVS